MNRYVTGSDPQVAYSLLMPANFPTSEKALDFQFGFIHCGGIPLLLSMISKNSFLAVADIPTKRYTLIDQKSITGIVLTGLFTPHASRIGCRSAYLSVLRLSKVVLSVVSSLSWRDTPESGGAPSLQSGPNVGASDYCVRAVANQLVQHLRGDAVVLHSVKPDVDVVKSLIRIAWASSSGDYKLLTTPWDELGSMPLGVATLQYQENEYCEDMQLCRYLTRFLLVLPVGSLDRISMMN